MEDLLTKLDDVLNGKATDNKPQSAVAQSGQKVAFLGAGTRAPTREEVTRYGLKGVVGKPNGQVVTDVQKGGPAERAGIQKGDILLRLDANEIFSRDDLDDFVRVSQPGATVKALIKRDNKEMELALTLGERTLNEQEAKSPRFVWDFAGPAQLEAALKRAKKEGKSVLVGLSGAETWWPTTRFEDGSFSQMFADARVIEASKNFVKIIIRRPHAYSFRQQHSQAPIPGITFLDADGKLKGTFVVPEKDAATKFVEVMKQMKWVVFYAQPGWLFSEQEREYLSQNGIDFTEKDVTAKPALWEELERLDVYTVPTLLVDGSAVVGFDRAQMDALLGLSAAGVDSGHPVRSK